MGSHFDPASHCQRRFSLDFFGLKQRAQSVLLNTKAEFGGPGWTQQQVAGKFGIDQSVAAKDMQNFQMEILHMSESAARGMLITAAADLDVAIPDLDAVVMRIVEQPLEDKARADLEQNPEWAPYIDRVPGEFPDYRRALKAAPGC